MPRHKHRKPAKRVKPSQTAIPAWRNTADIVREMARRSGKSIVQVINEMARDAAPTRGIPIVVNDDGCATLAN